MRADAPDGPPKTKSKRLLQVAGDRHFLCCNATKISSRCLQFDRKAKVANTEVSRYIRAADEESRSRETPFR